MKTRKHIYSGIAAFALAILILTGCSTPKTSTIKLTGTRGLKFTGQFGTETRPELITGILPLSIEVDRNELYQAEFRKTEMEGELVMQISSGPLSKNEIIATSEHAGVRGTVNEDGIWKLSNFH